MKEELKEVFNHFQNRQYVYVATCAEGQPRVRPMTLLYHNDEFFLATFSGDEKMKQINNNSVFEFCHTIKDAENTGYVRGSGKLEIIEDTKQRKTIFDEYDFIGHFWKTPENPDYVLLKLNIKEFEYMKPGEFKPEKHSL